MTLVATFSHFEKVNALERGVNEEAQDKSKEFYLHFAQVSQYPTCANTWYLRRASAGRAETPKLTGPASAESPASALSAEGGALSAEGAEVNPGGASVRRG